VNNIAWLMRRIPAFPVFGSGAYRVQPVSVDDVADMAMAAGEEQVSGTRDAAGPETFAFRDFVRLIAARIGVRVLFVPVPPGLGVVMGKAIAFALRDVLLTGDELRGLMGELLVSGEAPAGKVVFSEWLQDNGGGLGRVYASELARHYRWRPPGGKPAQLPVS
jgi:NADH dehydrogenase